MVQLQRPKIATPESAKILYCIHETGSLLIGDRFLPGYIADCIQMTEGLGHLHKLLIAQEGAKWNTDQEILARLIAQADDTIRWAKEIRSESYHQIHTLTFLSEWSAQEAGTENVIAAILETIKDAANVAASKFSVGRYDMKDWPWVNEKCLEIAQKLDQKAKEKTADGGWDISARLAVLFGWLGVTLKVEPEVAAKYNEASMVRNVIVHRYGRLGTNDVKRAPHLSEWIGKTVPMTKDRLAEYHQAIVDVHLAVMNGVLANGWK
ncbi:hypothetical protein [Pseudoduganella violacea]|uniref:RiboL-PSP-HEPN domain-containing protein n=1 Tax=Pseudoduganella violacea TaxID=1715466 RepID=A0A7W5BDZ2_9BURK|nr:hypothetical protein [Pseudoduganella violacea]MBB3121135.1 hypothetical protein [Pseudoduganella violacea]